MQPLHFLGSRAPLSRVFLYSSVRAYTNAASPPPNFLKSSALLATDRLELQRS